MHDIRTVALCAVAFIGLSSAVSYGAGAGVTGWRAYKFGMTAAQVRAVPGLEWSGGTPSSEMYLRAAKKVTDGGLSYVVDLHIVDNGLAEIALKNFSKSPSFDICEKKFLPVLARLEKTYGAFQPKHPEGVNQPVAGPYERNTDTVWKQSGASKYGEQIQRERSSPAASWMIAHVAEATHESNGHEIYASAYQEDGYDDDCAIVIIYRATAL